MMDENQPTILIKVRGGHLIGTGHLFRSLELARKLKRHFQVIFHLNRDSHLENLLEQEDINHYIEADVASIVKQRDVRLLLFDEPVSDEGLFAALKQEFPNLKIVAMGYFDYDNEWVDCIINLVNHNTTKSRPSAGHIQYYEGFEYAIIRSEFERYIGQERAIPSQVKNVLITFGGVDMGGNTAKILALLGQMGMTDLDVDIILGPLFDNRSPIENMLRSMPFRSHIQSMVTNVAEHMLYADLAFCGGGTTVMELLSLGTPAIVLPQNSRERRFAQKLEQEGAIKLLDNSTPIGDNINHVSGILNSSRKRRMMSNAGEALIDGRGAERVCNIIIRALEKSG